MLLAKAQRPKIQPFLSTPPKNSFIESGKKEKTVWNKENEASKMQQKKSITMQTYGINQSIKNMNFLANPFTFHILAERRNIKWDKTKVLPIKGNTSPTILRIPSHLSKHSQKIVMNR